jgi:hypothetical protein
LVEEQYVDEPHLDQGEKPGPQGGDQGRLVTL